MLNITNYQEMQIKTTVSYHLTPVRMAIMKKTKNVKHRQGCGLKKILVHPWESFLETRLRLVSGRMLSPVY